MSGISKTGAVGIIAEYDPFHNGHLYHIRKAKEISGADTAVVVMSGYFMQRGTPSFFPRDTRIRMAIDGGADLVIELPYIYACASSHDFAMGGVGILNGLGCVDSMVFGAETDDLRLLETAAQASDDSDERTAGLIRKLLSEGKSHGDALTEAAGAVYGERTAEVLRSPNNLLGIEYIKELKRQNSSIRAIPLMRHKALHDEPAEKHVFGSDGANNSENQVASGTAIREIFLKAGAQALRGLVPETSVSALEELDITGLYETQQKKMFDMIRFRVLTTSGNELSEIAGVDEGLENRLAAAVRDSSDFRGMLAKLATKRYTNARLRRMLINVMMNLKRKELYELRGCYYARVMGFSQKGRTLLKRISKSIEIPLFSNLGRLSLKDQNAVACLGIDLRASDLYSMISDELTGRNRETTFVPYIRNESEFI